MKFINPIASISILILALATSPAFATAADDIAMLQKRWAEVNYTLQGDEQIEAWEALASRADKIVAAYPGSAGAWIWKGIIKSSYAGAKGGLGALGLVKDSRKSLEKALSIDPDAMQGSAYTSLGALYFKVPGWPIGFGDDDKAKQLLKQALKINPNGIDSNYFYGEFLLENGKYQEAKHYLLKARNAAPRPERPLADEGRQREISERLDSIEKELLASRNENLDF